MIHSQTCDANHNAQASQLRLSVQRFLFLVHQMLSAARFPSADDGTRRQLVIGADQHHLIAVFGTEDHAFADLPAIFRGARFVTTMTWRPTISSGE